MSASPGDYRIDLKPSVQSPDDVFSIRTQNRDFNTYPLGTEGASLFDEQFNTLINDFDSRLMSELYGQRSQLIGNTAAYARQQFDEKMFGGINAGDNEIAFDVIRAGHIRADPSSGSIVNDWQYTHSSAGYNDWIGDGASNDYVVDEDQVLLVMGFTDTKARVYDTVNSEVVEVLDEPVTSGINVESFGRNVDMLPKDLNNSRLEDNKNDEFVQALPAVVGNDRDSIHVRLESDIPNEYEGNADYEVYSRPRLLGLTFGVGDYMNQEQF